jgi:TPR repeat protein/transglutaminase-like putative cysteine protease
MQRKFLTAGRIATFVASLAVVASLAACAPTNQRAMIERAAAAGDPTAKFVVIADRIVSAQDNRDASAAAIAEMVALAETGNVNAQLFLGKNYLDGDFGIQPDHKASLKWLEKAAAQNSIPAISYLTVVYGAGLGVEQDQAKALTYAKKAANSGTSDGFVAMGQCYALGWGVPKNEKTALEWYLKAANLSESIGMRMVGSAYRDGMGVKRDTLMAYAWYELATRHSKGILGKNASTSGRDQLALVMLPSEINQAKLLAESWKPGSDLVAERLTLTTKGSTQTAQTSQDQNIITAATTTSNVTLMQSKDIPVIDLLSSIKIDVAADGTYTTTSHIERQIRKEAAITNFSQIPVGFNNTFDQVEITEAYTKKPNGSRLDVMPSAIYEQPVPGSPTVPIFNDQRMKVIVFPNVTVGDTLVMTSKTISKPLLEGLFTYSTYFSPAYAANDIRLEITAPASMPLLTQSHDINFKQSSRGDKTLYQWQYSNPKPPLKVELAIDPMDRWPRIFVSSSPSYEAFAKTYTQAIETKTIVTPKLQKLADSITAGTSNKRKQAALLHDWVSQNIRYVAVMFGHDAIIPHDATAVYEAGYGDCKDHSALLVTLLKAKGIPAQITLINYGESYALAKPPTFGSLNHAITYIPEFDLFTDTTAAVADFGVLPFGEYGKPVIIATKSGQVVRRTPLVKTEDATLTANTSMTMNNQGRLIGQTTISGTGPFAVALRATARDIQATGPEQAAAGILRAVGDEGTGNFIITPPMGTSGPYKIKGTFETINNPQYIEGNSFQLPQGLNFAGRPGDVLLGPIDFYDLAGQEPTPCYAGRVIEEIKLTLPSGKGLKQVPKPFSIQNDTLQYSSSWSFAGGTVTNRREFVSLSKQPVCIGDIRSLAAIALNDIRGDYHTAVTLVNK